MTTRSKKETLAADTWRRVFDFFWQHKDAQLGVLREMGLTPGHMKALFVLDLDEPRPMGALADALACDASTVTWLVDSLEERGIVERQPLTTDRRVKTVVLTPIGAKTKAELLDRLYEPPQVLRDLDMQDLDALNAVLRKLPGEGP
ncbi:MAG: MarR family winged helix-turn-helix transcriptional regulator [Actinomycetota bacterium]